MKQLIESFKTFLEEGPKKDYIINSQITLYHYAPSNEEEILLDPQRFGTSSFSKRERESSTVPRIFFYTNLSQRERMVASNRSLYTVNIGESMVYDLNTDPEGYVDSVRHPIYGLRKGIELDELMYKIKEKYSGMFYTTGNMDIVAWFEPIMAKKVTDEERKSLEG